VSDLVRGKIGLFNLDRLVTMLASAGLHIEVQVGKAA
jgi:predicted XRE-type DNA-binding protein